MARINLTEANDRLDNQKNFGYINTFFLTKDKEHTIVKPLLSDMNDLEVHSIHEVKMTSKNGKDYRVSVDCLGDGCPMCREALKHADKMFPLVSKVRDNIYIPLIRLYDRNGEYNPAYEIFVRSTRFYRDTLAPAVSRYGLDGYWEIERIGGPGSKKTTYNLYSINKDFDSKPLDNSKTLEQLKEDFEVKEDDIFGRRDSLIKSWSAADFAEFLETGTYPKGSSTEDTDEEEEEVKPRSRNRHGF